MYLSYIRVFSCILCYSLRMNLSPPTLNSVTAAIDSGGADRNAAVRTLHLSLDGHGPLISPEYLQPLRKTDRLNRGAAAVLLDTAARACVDAQSVGTRLAVITAHRIEAQRAYQRLGYRAIGDYAREELGITVRAFRDLARLGGRLEALPATKSAFLGGEITRTQAEIVASIASGADENEWLARAQAGTVRELKAAVREARERTVVAGVGEPAVDAGPDAQDESDSEGEPRRRYCFDVPAEMLGKIDAVLELAARVAGAAMPPGTLWELIAAEYLSGVPAPVPLRSLEYLSGAPAPASLRPLPLAGASDTERDGPLSGGEAEAGAVPGPRSGEESPAGPHRPPEDPRGFQELLESESRNWGYLPSARPSLELHGDWKQLRNRCTEDGPRSAWDLHRDLTAALAAEGRVAWQLGRLLGTIRNRRLWRTMLFASFAHYVRERLGISVRAADRLIRLDREGWKYAPLGSAYQAGELSPLAAETLVRVLPHVGIDPDTQQAWIDYAQKTTFERLCKVVRTAERLRASQAPQDRALLGFPREVEGAMGEAGSEPPMFVTSGTRGAEAASPMFVNSPACARYAVWMNDGEHEVLERAVDAVRGSKGGEGGPGREIPIWVCLDALLDHFLSEYDGVHARQMRKKYALFDRDGWQCRVPGCCAYGPLHLHHIVFRSHGGGDEPENLVSLCDFHHKALHDGWIRCVGRAPDALYWELGVDRSEGLSEMPVARIAGNHRLAADEYWDGVSVRPMTADHAPGSAEPRAA